MKVFKMKTTAFNISGNYKILVDGDKVLVWDNIAKHFTSCHALSRGSMRAARIKARKA